MADRRGRLQVSTCGLCGARITREFDVVVTQWVYTNSTGTRFVHCAENWNGSKHIPVEDQDDITLAKLAGEA